MTDSELLEAILAARRLEWVSATHRAYLADLELEARSRNLKL